MNFFFQSGMQSQQTEIYQGLHNNLINRVFQCYSTEVFMFTLNIYIILVEIKQILF